MCITTRQDSKEAYDYVQCKLNFASVFIDEQSFISMFLKCHTDELMSMILEGNGL